MSQIVYIANLWSLTEHPSARREWTLERKIKAVAVAKFDGITTRLTPEHRRLADKHGLGHLIGYISSSEPAEFGRLVQEQKAAGAVRINVQLDDHDTPPRVAVKDWIKLERLAEKAGTVASLEIHRDTCTETPEKTYEIADRYHALTGQLIRLTLDYSHLAVVKHLAPDGYVERLLTHPDLIQSAEQIHFRPFNGHHCQVPVTHRGELTPEVRSYLTFAAALMKVWLAKNGGTALPLFACPEMGPLAPGGGGYNLTGLPPAWMEAVRLKEELARCWRKLA
jgi:hypothetical protein